MSLNSRSDTELKAPLESMSEAKVEKGGKLAPEGTSCTVELGVAGVGG